ncbi:MAG TPA: hypothetical protein VMT61_14850 [Candidatus Binataceae bacterium]|nr:hypothetical protein [Candidatus Binataceae bacterium]
MTTGDVLLVGSVPRESAREVFQICSSELEHHLQALPDGEVGPRKSWIQCQALLVFHQHPAIETIRRPPTTDGLAVSYLDNWIFRLKPGTNVIQFDDLKYAGWAVESYRLFAEMRKQGAIPDGLRFQVSLPTPLGGCVTFFDQPQDLERVYRGYVPAMMREIEKICAQIPAQDLAIQWDVCVEILEIATKHGLLEGDPLARAAASFEQLGKSVPSSAMLGYHLCYGDLGHRHLVEPDSLSLSVDMANLAVAHSGRRVDWVHMPVPVNRRDDNYFAPLRDLTIGDTKLYLGLIHRQDSVEGALARAAIARQHLPRFGVATECGLGRRDPETLTEVLRLHREVAERLSK